MGTFIINNATGFYNQTWQTINLLIEDGYIRSIVPSIENFNVDAPVIDADHHFLFPGFVDVHVHLRQPGFSYKETILTGTMAAARGGFTAVCTMPNLDPVPDDLDSLQVQRDLIQRDSLIHVYPFGSISRGEQGKELSDMDAMAPYVAGFSDDGVGVRDGELMKKAMLKANSLSKLIVAHAEDAELTGGGVIHDGDFARSHGFKGNPSASEWKQVERDIDLVRATGAGYHVCHVSSKESLDLVRRARLEGLSVSCETAPHYLCLNDSQLEDDGRFRMNPPIRSRQDQLALQQALIDRTLICIATDHAPHSDVEKSGGLAESLNGIVGLETAFPVLYTDLVRTGILTLERLIELLTLLPIERFRLDNVIEAKEGPGPAKEIKVGQACDLTLFDLDHPYQIDSRTFLSKGRATPFDRKEVYGKCLLTLVAGQTVWQDPNFPIKGKEESR